VKRSFPSAKPIWTVPPCSSWPNRISSVNGFAQLELHQSAERPRPEHRIEALLGEIRASLRQQLDRDLALAQLGLELEHELVDDRLHHVERQRLEGDDPVEAVPELGREEALERLAAAALVSFTWSPAKPIVAWLISREPAFEVMIRITWRKSAFRPVLSVSVALSITCSRMPVRSGCAFSISSSSTTE
jgi:hypothetical protein